MMKNMKYGGLQAAGNATFLTRIKMRTLWTERMSAAGPRFCSSAADKLVKNRFVRELYRRRVCDSLLFNAYGLFSGQHCIFMCMLSRPLCAKIKLKPKLFCV